MAPADMGVRHARVESDSWVHVQDPKKRKQIQDRLAQRARRMFDLCLQAAGGSTDRNTLTGKRLAESKRILVTEELQRASDDGRSLESIGTSPTSSSFATDISPPSTSVASSDSSRDSRLSMGSDNSLLNRRVSSVYAALFNNGTILGLRCGIQVPILSPPCTDKIPLSLHPTQLQMTVLHIPWIDRFPFPKMRDNAITHSCEGFDDEDFFCDLFTDESFEIKPGSYSWDPEAWVMTDRFRTKWGYFFA